ncbi:MAG: SRPBCC family protein [Rhodobacteraceae bacterium]|nr:SRPBCC family protein [Paracoccaceae bacterium]
MPRVVRSTVIAAPVEAVWEVLRDFNGHDRWHPEVAESQIERGWPSDRVGCVRRFRLADGAELREQLLTLSDIDMAFTYCLLDTPIPLLNYVAHVRLAPVTDGDLTFWHWESRFDAPEGRAAELARMVGEAIYEGGFAAIRAHLGPAGRSEP